MSESAFCSLICWKSKILVVILVIHYCYNENSDTCNGAYRYRLLMAILDTRNVIFRCIYVIFNRKTSKETLELKN